MKKLISISSATAVLLTPALLFAAGFAGGTIGDVLERITSWLLWLLGAVVVIAIIIAAFYFVTAQGDSEKVGKARSFVLWALVGLAVGLLALVLVNLVATITGGNLNAP